MAVPTEEARRLSPTLREVQAHPRPRPSWIGYLLAGLLAVAGIGAAIAIAVAGVSSLDDRVDDFQRVPAGTTGEVTLDEGDFTVYVEDAGFVSVGITAPSGDVVFLDPYDSEVTYSFGSFEGEALFSFEAEEGGTYLVETTGSGTVAIGEGIGGILVRTVLVALTLALVGVILATVLAVVTGVRRGRWNRANRPPPMAWGPPQGPWGQQGHQGGWAPPPGQWQGPPAAPQPAPGQWSPPPS